MSDESPSPDAFPDESSTPSLAVGAVSVVTMAVAFGLLAAGVDFFWVAFPVGFGGGVPFVVAAARWYDAQSDRGRDFAERAGRREPTTASSDGSTTDDRTHEDRLEALRNSYARGEIDEAEFEARLEDLLEAEAADDSREQTRTRSTERET
jgi:hypothetical protein